MTDKTPTDSATSTPDVAESVGEFIITLEGERVLLSDYLATEPDDTYIVYTDDAGKQRRIKRSTYERKDL